MAAGGAAHRDTLQLARRWAAHAAVEPNDLPEAPHGLIHFPTAMGRAACGHVHGWINRRLNGQEP